MKKQTFILSLLLMMGINAQAQKQFSLHAHITPAMGNFKIGVGSDFNGTIDYKDPFGHAGTGLGLGIDYHHPFGDNGLHGLVAIDVIRNPIKRAWRQANNLEIDETETKKYSSYFNIPITLGLHYQKDVKEGTALFIQAGGILDILKVTNSKYTHTYASGEIKIREEHFNLSTSFGFGVSCGVVIKDTYIIGIGYKALGIHNIGMVNIYTDDDGVETSDDSTQKHIAMLNLTFGINL